MIFDLTAKKLISYEPSKSSENLRKNFVAFIRGLISFPVDIPGTAYHECMQVHHICCRTAHACDRWMQLEQRREQDYTGRQRTHANVKSNKR